MMSQALDDNLDRRIGNLAGTQFGKVAAFARQLKIIHHFTVDGREITALALGSEVRHRGGRLIDVTIIGKFEREPYLP